MTRRHASTRTSHILGSKSIIISAPSFPVVAIQANTSHLYTLIRPVVNGPPGVLHPGTASLVPSKGMVRLPVLGGLVGGPVTGSVVGGPVEGYSRERERERKSAHGTDVSLSVWSSSSTHPDQ